MNHKRILSVLLPILFVTSLMVPLLTISTTSTVSANPGWWNTSWAYRRVITISPLNPENYQIKVVIPSAIAKSDYPSIRFLENETSGLLPYWIERNEGNYLSVAWVRRLENADSTIYMYYGNVSATSAENGDNVFLFFDKFAGSLNSNKWSTTEGNVSVDTNVLHLWANGKIEHGEGKGLTTDEESTRRVIETRMKNATNYRGGLLISGSGWNHEETACIFTKGGGEYRFWSANFNGTQDGGYLSQNNRPQDVWYVLSVDLYGDSKDKVKSHFYWGNDNASYRQLVEESQEDSGNDWAPDGNKVDKYSLRAWDDSSSYYFDWILVRRYASTEPVATVEGSATHGPILILSDGQFDGAHGVNGGGDGSAGNPYIIENYIINSSAAIGMIDIRNTTKYFVVRNCVLENGLTGLGTGYIGIRLSTVVNGKVENCVSRNNTYGIALYYQANNNVVTNNTFENNYWYGVRLENSDNNLISNNLIENNSSNYWAIGTWKDKNNILDNNTCENGGGIYLYDTENLKMRNNTVSWVGRRFAVEGDTLSHFVHDIDNSNLLNGRPLIYLVGHSNEVIGPSPEIGYLGLVNCDNILVENLVFARRTGTQNTNGILMANTQNSRVENCTFENNIYGIYLWGSDNNILANNTCDNNTKYGIFILYSSDNNIIENNTILKNPLSTGAGIGFYYNPLVHYDWSFGTGNIIRNNNITSNGLGISILENAENNQIYHNSFENNTTQAYDNSSNYWDDGYPSGGNYWSDYTGTDNNGDGIGDTPYPITGGANQDYYPLMNPWQPSFVRGPIFIVGNDNFIPEKGVNGGGSGTELDPYIIENWIISAENAHGIEIRNTTAYFVVRNCVIENGDRGWPTPSYYGIKLQNVANGRIENNFNENNNYGIVLYANSRNNVVNNNTFENYAWFGVRTEYSHNNIISNNFFGITKENTTSATWAINLFRSDNYNLENNTVENRGGIYLYDAENVRMRNNTHSSISSGFGVEDDNGDLAHFLHDIDNSNLVNGKPILYLIGHSNEVIDSSQEVGFLGLVNCDNMRVENLVFARRENNRNLSGILMANIQNSRVENCTFENNTYGIYLWGSNNNILTHNSVDNNLYGIDILYSSDNNILEYNTITKNREPQGYAIYFYNTDAGSNNIIRNNDITLNNRGIYFNKSDNNRIYHNNIINNTLYQAYDNGSNYWDDGYPSGGNYWSDYTGEDNYRGENQNVSGSDGIGDTPFAILGGTNQDKYPLMGPWPNIIRSVSVSIAPSDNSGANGALLTYTVTVTNNGNIDDTYDLTCGDNAGWSPSVLPTSISVAAFSSDSTTTLSVTIPSGAIGGTIDNMWVQAVSENDAGVFDNKSCTAEVTVSTSVSVSIAPTSQSGVPGATLNYTVIINNTGNVSDTYALDNTDTLGWTLSLSSNSVVVPAFSFDNTTTLSVTILGTGIDNVTVTANGISDSDSDNVAAVSTGVLYSMNLFAGWNLVCFPVDNSPTTPSGLFDNMTYLTDYIIYRWTAPAGPYVLVGVSDVLKDNFGYWVWINTNKTLTWSGTQPTSRNVYLVPGWNMVGFPIDNASSTPSNKFSGLTYLTNYIIYSWTAPAGPYVLQSVGTPFKDNTGYWVWIDQPWTVTVP